MFASALVRKRAEPDIPQPGGAQNEQRQGADGIIDDGVDQQHTIATQAAMRLNPLRCRTKYSALQKLNMQMHV